MTGVALDARIVVERPGFVLDVALHAAPGEVVAVMGPSGAGKSTLLGALAGLVPLSDGHVRLGERMLDAAPGDRIHVTPSRRGVVLLGQDPRLFPHLSSRDNVAFGLLARGIPKRDAGSAAEGWLSRVGLDGMGARRPAELSGGQQQRVAIARALATAPAALLLDEPLTSLDTETAGDLRAMLREQLSATQTTAVVATHDAVDSVSLADALVVVEEGRVTQSGRVRDVLRAPASRFVAAVSGLNRVVGTVKGGQWSSGGMSLPHAGAGAGAGTGGGAGAGAGAGVAVTAGAGAVGVAAIFPPGAVHLESAESARSDDAGDGWTARVTRLEPTPAGVRVRTTEPEVAVDLSADRVAEAGLAPGRAVALRVDPDSVRFVPV
jgi:molybdate transport system ATP-binding protein